MEKRMEAVMTDEQVVRYTELTARRLEIVMHSGASWKPEYAQELEEIDKEIAVLRGQVDAALEAKATLCHAAAEGASMEALPCAESESLEKTGDCLDCEYCEFCDGLREGEQPESEDEVTVTFSVKSEELHDLVSTYDDWEKLRCQVMPEKHRLGMDIPELYHLLAVTGHDVMQHEVKEFQETLEARAYMESLEQDTDPERQQLKQEVRQAYLNGGRTGWLYDIDGNEYYTTRDGVRHYTRQEG